MQAALEQIRKKRYAEALTAKGIDKTRIRKYGIGFQGKEAVIEEFR